MAMQIKIIDDVGKDIGCIDYSYLVKLGLRHQIVKLLIYCDKSRTVLLQQRSKCDDSCPGMWDNSASGHVDANEDNLSAIVRETKEELGLKINFKKLKHIGDYNTEEKLKNGFLRRRTAIYLYLVDSTDINIAINHKELEKIEWVDLSVVEKIVYEHDFVFKGDMLTKGLVKSIEMLLNDLNDSPIYSAKNV